MTVRECTVRGRIACEHIVQFFDTDESRAECVAEFLADGVANGEPVIIVARPSNWAATRQHLRARGVPVQRAIDAGMVVLMDADDCLQRISRDGVPDGAAFDDVIGKSVATLARRGARVRAYGEMVDRLALRGELAEAITLEGLWNRLGEHTPLFLLCGYSAAHFVGTATHRALRDICSAHARVHRHEQDPLANWILKSSHDAGGAAPILH